MRTVILCVNSVWHLDPATVPPAETQGNIEYTSCGILSDKGLSCPQLWRKIFLHGCKIKSGSGLGTRLTCTNCIVV